MVPFLALSLGLAAAVVIDVRTRRIPNWLTGAIVGGGEPEIAVALRRGRLADTVHGATQLMVSPTATRETIVAPRRGNRFAYGPAIAAGTLITLLVQP
jgi:Flp pilus assembly protein protease CpaA